MKPDHRFFYDAIGLCVVTFTVTFLIMWKVHAKRILLESGLLSIHPYAIMWNLVIVVHCRALENLGIDKNNQLKCFINYTPKLSEQALEITKYITKDRNIEDWINSWPDKRKKSVPRPEMV